MKILFTGGGTGGHIFPLVAVVREIRRICPEEERKKLKFFYLGPQDPFASIFLAHEGVIIKEVMAGKIRRYSHWKNILENIVDICFKIPIGIIQSFFYIFILAPDVLFSKGGYGSVPATIAAWLLWVPIFLHESDSTPGLANRILSKFSSKIFISYPNTEYFSPKKTVWTGNPIRKEILNGTKEEAKELFKLTYQKPILLILGGSQGAQRINDLILNILPELLPFLEIIHQAGENNFKQIKAESDVAVSKELKKYYHIYPFFKEIELSHAYSAADLIISRAGSGVIFEIAAVGKPSVLIPLPESAQNHQARNAFLYAQTGAAVVIEEENFKRHFFLEKIKYLISHPNELETMGQKAKEFARPEAAKIIADYLISYLTARQ